MNLIRLAAVARNNRGSTSPKVPVNNHLGMRIGFDCIFFDIDDRLIMYTVYAKGDAHVPFNTHRIDPTYFEELS